MTFGGGGEGDIPPPTLTEKSTQGWLRWSREGKLLPSRVPCGCALKSPSHLPRCRALVFPQPIFFWGGGPWV